MTLFTKCSWFYHEWKNAPPWKLSVKFNHLLHLWNFRYYAHLIFSTSHPISCHIEQLFLSFLTSIIHNNIQRPNDFMIYWIILFICCCFFHTKIFFLTWKIRIFFLGHRNMVLQRKRKSWDPPWRFYEAPSWEPLI